VLASISTLDGSHRKVRKQGLEHFIKFVRDLPVPTPQAMYEQLEGYGYRGQEQARARCA